LSAALAERARPAWVDWEGIPPTAEWLKEIHAAIEGTSAFVVLCSPDSLASQVCKGELEHAVACNKRIVPVVCRDFDAKAAPTELARLNWIFVRDGDGFDTGVDALLTAIDTDFDWVKQHTRVLVRATEWSLKRERSLLLRGDDLKTAEAWLVRAGTGTRPDATALQREYLLESRRDATRRQRWLVGVSLGVAIGAAVLAVVAVVNAYRAKVEAAAALSRQLAAQSGFVLSERPSEQTRALLLATDAILRAPSPTLETDQALRTLLASAPRFVTEVPNVAPTAILGADGRYVAWAEKGDTRLWTVEGSAAGIRSWPGAGSIDSLEFDATGQVVLTVSDRKIARLRDANTGSVLAERTLASGVAVLGAAVAPGGKHLALLGSDRIVHVLDSEGSVEGEFEVDVLGGAQGTHVLMRFSAEGRFLSVASVRALRFCRVAELGACAAPATDEQPSDRQALEFSADGRLLTVLQNRGVQIFETQPGLTLVTSLARPEGRAIARFSPDSLWIATGGAGGRVEVFDPRKQGDAARVVSIVAEAAITGLSFAPDSNAIAAASSDGMIRVWQLPDGKRVAELPGESVLGFVANGTRILATAAPSVLRVWESRARVESARLELAASATSSSTRWLADVGHAEPVTRDRLHNLDLSADGRRLWGGHGDSASAWELPSLGGLGTVQPAPPLDWTALLPKLIRRCSYRDVPCKEQVALDAKEGTVEVQSVSPDGEFVTTSRADGQLRVFRLGSSTPLLSEAGVTSFALSNKFVAVGAAKLDSQGEPLSDSSIQLRLYAIPTGQKIAELPVSDGLLQVLFSPDAERAAVFSHESLAMLDASSGHVLWRHPNPDWGRHIAFSADGRLLAATCGNCLEHKDALEAWDVTSGKSVRSRIPLPAGSGVLAVNADGTRLAVGSQSGNVSVFDQRSGQVLGSLDHTERIVDLTFSHDQNLVASASEDNTVRLLDLSSGQEIARLSPEPIIKRVTFGPHDAYLATLSANAVQVWHWRAEELATEACKRVPGDLDAQSWRQYLGDKPPLACRAPKNVH
jgi:WD40 repeat protein